MNSSQSDAEQLLAYLAGELPSADTVALEARLKKEPQLAEQFLALARDEAVLAEWAKLVPCVTESQPQPASSSVFAPMRRKVYAAALVLALAACLLLAVRTYYSTQPTPVAGPIAVIEDAQGEVLLLVNGESSPVEKGQKLFLGAELRTGGEGSYAVVRYPDAASLELSADTTARLERGAPKQKGDADSRRVYVPEGMLTAEVTETPMVLATPHAEVRAGIGAFVFNIVSASTYIEPERGRAQVTRRGKDMFEIEAGFYAVASEESVSKPRLRPTPVTAPLALLIDGNTPVISLICTPDGNTLISGSTDGNVRFWDVEARQLKQTLKAHTNGVRALAITPDGRTLVTAGQDRYLRVWDLATSEEKYTLRRQRTDIEDITLAPDGRTLAVGFGSGRDGYDLRLYDIPTGLECGALRTTNPKNAVTAVAFSFDGLTLATGGRDGKVRIWDVMENADWSTLRGPGLERFTFRERRVIDAHTLEIRDLAFSPNDRLLATAGREGIARVWGIDEGEAILHLTEHGRDVRSVAFAPDGARLATTGGDGTARVWQMSDGQEYAIYRSHKQSVSRAVFFPNGALIATGGVDKSIKLWKLQPPPVAAGL